MFSGDVTYSLDVVRRVYGVAIPALKHLDWRQHAILKLELLSWGSNDNVRNSFLVACYMSGVSLGQSLRENSLDGSFASTAILAANSTRKNEIRHWNMPSINQVPLPVQKVTNSIDAMPK